MHPAPEFQHGRLLAAVRILLLEDDETFAGLVRANLERAAWSALSIEHTGTLRDALARLERGGIDLVITDLNLPDSKGLATLESLVRATDRLILVLTGERDAGLREAAIGCGAYDLMSKERLDRAELERLIRFAAIQANTFRSLRDSEERFRGLTELSSDWYWEQDADLRFVATGGTTDARGGITPEAHVGKCRWELPSTEILNQTWDEHRAVLEARQPFHDLLLRRAGTTGDAHYISVSGRPIFDRQGGFCGYRGAAKDVTETVRRDRALRDGEERFRGLTKLSSDWYWEQDSEFRLTFMSRQLGEKTGLDPNAYLGRKRWEQPALNLTEADWDRHRAQLERHEPFHDFEMHRRTEAGRGVWLSLSGEPVFGEAGGFAGYRGVGKDITERKRTEQLHALEQAVSRSLSEASNASEALKATIRAVCETEGWECGRYFGADEKAGVLRFVESWGVEDPAIQNFAERSRELVYQPGAGLMGRVWQSGQPIWVADLAEDSRALRSGFSDDLGIRGGFVFAVKSEGKTIGVLAFNSRELRQPEERLLEAIHLIGSQVGQLLERKRAEEEQRRFRAAIDVSADFVLLIDPASMLYVDANETACRALGYSREELLAMSPHQLFSASREELVGVYARLIAGDRSAMTAEGWFRRKDGSRIFIESFRRAVPSAKGHIIVAVSRDIGERRRGEELLKLEHTVTRALAAADSVGTALREAIRAVCETEGWECGRYLGVDQQAGVLRVGEAWSAQNPAIQRFIAESREVSYAPGVGLAGRVWESGQPLWVADLDKDSRTVQKSITREIGLHGAIFFPVVSEAKVIGVLAFNSREVREPEERLLQAVRVIGSQIGQFVQRRQAEQVLRESEERFRSLTGLSSDWYWEQDENFLFTLISSAAKDKTGRGPMSNIGKTRWDLPALNMTEADWAAHRALLEARQPFYDLKLHRRTAEGKSKYTSISGEPVFDAAGAFKGYRGIGKDVTERKREERLLNLEHTVTRCLAEADSASAALKATMHAVCEAAGWECGRYFRLDEEAGLLRFAEAWTGPGETMDRFVARSREVSYALGEGFVGRVWQSGEPLWIADIAEDPRVHSGIARQIGMHGAFFFLVRSEGKTIGVFSFHSWEVRKQEERLLQAMNVIGSQIGQFVQRKLAEEVLRESEARFRSLTGLSSDFYWETDAEHRMLQTHYAGQHKPVIPRGQRFGKTRWEVPSTHPDAAGWAAHRATLEAHLLFRDFELARIDDHGVERYLSISGEPMFDAAGGFKGYRGVGKDITPRKKGEERQATHARYQEKIARFGASALGKREAVDLVEDALQAVIQALPATVVAYIEPGAGPCELVMRGCAGLAGEPVTVASYGKADAVAQALEHGELAVVDRTVSGAALLPFDWAGRFRCAALVPVHGDNRVQGALCVLSGSEGAFGPEESRFLVTAASVLSAGLRRIDSEGRLAFLAQFDALTGLPNRALLSDRFSQMIVQARRHDKLLGVLFIDLDDFKLVNDSLGHAGGDDLLKETARRLQASVRAGDTVARISGDEFAVILGDLARPDDAALVAQKIIDRLAAPFQARGQEVFVTASIGIAAFPTDGDDAEALLGAADAAMYRAKQSGRNAYQFFTAEINQRTRARAQLGSELRRALERDEFSLAYQPKFDLRTGRPCAVEALLRWRHPERGLVPPVEFIPVLEETGLIVPVGEWVLGRACEDLKAWQAAGLPPMPVAVNLSARQFRQQDLDVRIRELVSGAGVAPELIELEITESQLMQDPDHAKRVIQALSDGGIGVAIDDFGTGYSSLSYLTRFPVAALKIDRSFVAAVLSERAAAAIVRTIIDMAHTLGFMVIAEGVETEAQALLLRGLGCEQAQGYYFAKPMPEAEFRKLILSYPSDSARQQIRGKR